MMNMPSHADAFEVLCLQAADHGRGQEFFGESFARARRLARPNGRYAFTLLPQWVKARWCECGQQPSKLYHCVHAGLL